MKQEISPKMLAAVLAAGVVILAGVAFWVWRAPSATAIDAVPAASGGEAADSGITPTAGRPRGNRGREMAEEMRSHARGAQRDR